MDASKADETLYQIDGEFKTNVLSYQSVDKEYCSVTYSNGRSYRYHKERIQKFSFRNTLQNITLVETGTNARRYPAAVHVYFCSDQYVYCSVSKDGKIYFYNEEEAELMYDCSHPPYIFSYLKELSRFRNKDKNVPSISIYYDLLKGFPCDSLLGAFCNPSSYFNRRPHRDSGFLIFPFGCNESQAQAVKNAMNNRMSVIQGPPGTGKTQTILNILANLLINDKNCIVVSGNNEATNNVTEKLCKHDLGFLAAALGSSENRKEFCQKQTDTLPMQISIWKLKRSKQEKIKKELQNVSQSLDEYFRNQSRLAVLKARHSEISHQLTISGNSDIPEPSGFHIPMSSSRLNRILMLFDREMESHGKISMRTRLMALISGLDISNPDSFITYIHRKEHSKISREISKIEKWLQGYSSSYEKFQKLSMRYLKARLADRYEGRGNRKIWKYRTEYREDQNMAPRTVYEFSESQAASLQFLKDYPIVTSTTFSASRCLHPDVMFDFMIMDESSQVSIAEGALAVNQASNAVIVGDVKQLPNVVRTCDIGSLTDIFHKYLPGNAYNHVNNSFLSSLIKLFPEDLVPQTILKEHYRCSPKIIGFCNNQFYGGVLETMTPYDEDTCPLLEVLTVQGNHATNEHTNPREAEEVARLISKLEEEGHSDIGIITPYKNQAQLILQKIGHRKYIAATVHSFQGRENDVIIMSTVSNDADKFVDDPNLINVAVSRAKKRFILVRTGNEIKDSNLLALSEYIKYHGRQEAGQLRSIFDILYGQYTEERRRFISSRRWISEYVSENRMFELLEKITDSPEGEHLQILFEYPLRKLLFKTEGLDEQEILYAQRSWTHVDFVLSDKTTKLPVLAIEVDGYGPHSEQKRKQHDTWKSHILLVNGIELLRFSTKGSEEEKQIIQKLLEVNPYYRRKHELNN